MFSTIIPLFWEPTLHTRTVRWHQPASENEQASQSVKTRPVNIPRSVSLCFRYNSW